MAQPQAARGGGGGLTTTTSRHARACRLFDIAAALSGIVVTLPLLLIGAVAVLLTSGRPVLYAATRVGQGGVRFRMFKLRTMQVGADRAGAITSDDDARVTPAGRVLRLLKIDELPQLYNVLRGDMAIVGPRPEDPGLVDDYPDWGRRLLDVRPGVTSPSAIAFRHEGRVNPSGDRGAYASVLLPAKLKIDLEYFERRTLVTDVGLMVRTLVSLGRLSS